MGGGVGRGGRDEEVDEGCGDDGREDELVVVLVVLEETMERLEGSRWGCGGLKGEVGIDGGRGGW